MPAVYVLPGGLPLQENLQEKQIDASSGLLVIDLKSGDIVHWLRFDGVIQELYDVVVLPGVVRPTALGFKTDEISRMITVGGTVDVSRQLLCPV